MVSNAGFTLFIGLALCAAIACGQSTGHCQRYQNCVYETRQHYIACLGGIGTAILLDNANNLEAHRLLAYHDNWKKTCIEESAPVDEAAFTRRAALRHQSMMECFGKPFIITDTNMTEEKHLTCSGIQTELSGFGSVFQTAAVANECSMIYRRVLKRCDILAECCPQYEECSKRNQQQYHNQYHAEKEMADKLLDCLKEGPKYTTGLAPHIGKEEKEEKEVSFTDLPPEVQNELIQNTFERRHSPQSDAAPPAPVEISAPAPPPPPGPPAPLPVPSPSTVSSTSTTTTTTSSTTTSTEAASSPVPPPSVPSSVTYDPWKEAVKNAHLDSFTEDPIKTVVRKAQNSSDVEEKTPLPEVSSTSTTTTTASTSTAASTEASSPLVLPTLLPTLPPLPTFPPPEKAWNDLVHMLFPNLVTSTAVPPSSTTPIVSTEDPLSAAAKRQEKEMMSRKMEFLNKFYCSEYMRCEESVAVARTNCEKVHFGDLLQYGIANTKLRERLNNNSKVKINGVKTACMAFITDRSVKEYNQYESESALVDNICASEAAPVILQMGVIERCDATLHYKPKNETEEDAADLKECLERVETIEKRCFAIRDCCPQHDTCAQKEAPGAKEKLEMFLKQVDAEQERCESTLKETIGQHLRNMERFKLRYLTDLQ